MVYNYITGLEWKKKESCNVFSSLLCAQPAFKCYANDHLDCHIIEESRHNIYLKQNTTFDVQSYGGNESNSSLRLEIAFPELHFTASCWIHSSGNSSWMFHHRPDPWGWYNPFITHTHSQRGTFTSRMWWIWESTGCHFICSGSDLIAYSMRWDTNMIKYQDRRRC